MGFPCFYSRNKRKKDVKIYNNKSNKNLQDNNIIKINHNKSNDYILEKKYNDFSEEYIYSIDNDENSRIDDNIEITNYFKNLNKISMEKYKTNELMLNYQEIMNKINNNINNIYENRNINNISQKIENEFNFKKDIQHNFENTKNCLNLCSNLTLEDEDIINQMSFSKYLNDENNCKNVFKNLINKNKEEIINIVNNSN